MRRSNRILRTRDEQSPSAQLSFDLKTIAKRSAAKRTGSTSINQPAALRESSTPKSGHSTKIPSSSPLCEDNNITEAAKGQLRRSQRHQQRRLRSSSDNIYDLDVDSPSAGKVQNVVLGKQLELTPDTESSEGESSSSYVECEDTIGTQKSPERPCSEIPLVVIDNTPTSLLTDNGTVHRESVNLDDSDDGNHQEKAVSELSEAKGRPLPDSDYGFTNTDEDEDQDEEEAEDEDESGRNGILDTLELEEEVSIPNMGLRDDAVFWDASKIFDQERNWRELISEAHGLIGKSKGLAIGSTKDLFKSISNGIDTYKGKSTSRNSHQNFASAETEEISIAGLEKGVSQVMIELYPYNADSPRKLRTLTSLAYEVAADIIPGIVGLLQWCLVTHYSNDSVTDEGIDQVTRILDCIERLCEAVQAEPPKPPPGLAAKLRITSVLVRFMAYVFRHQQLNTRQPAATQHPAGWSRNTSRRGDKYDTESVEPEEPTVVFNEECPWSRAESETFFEALRKYRGPERYGLILREFGDVLGHRSIDELREKAVETRAGLLALPDERRPHYSQWSFLDD
ncbi:hypothetical protein MGYG_01419 [Nannizzia gypsea CBS 118893]|uniref:Uncharacterized protein n=1 Tax=Arthroderma gypseum (strain ATCC MYA-4604 / CBS 118893) TaxID=535722 RepID=E5R0U7_ARTGP|nr:hypothetical protein MGYG_01419 [Nannizzia gypsea CBS 118893]EFQ98389.1 hypothetical protein MGYG_01419 [Nannizzia gypsea CBS 118893]